MRGKLRFASVCLAYLRYEDNRMSISAYGLRARPIGIGTVPRDFCGFDARYRNEEKRIRHGVVFYNRALTAKEISDFELQIVDINEPKQYNYEWKH